MTIQLDAEQFRENCKPVESFELIFASLLSCRPEADAQKHFYDIGRR